MCCQRSCNARVWSRESVYRLWLKITHIITKQGTRHFVYVESLTGKSLNSSPLPLLPLPFQSTSNFVISHFISIHLLLFSPLPWFGCQISFFIHQWTHKKEKNQKTIKQKQRMKTNNPPPPMLVSPSNLHNLIIKSELNMKHHKT